MAIFKFRLERVLRLRETLEEREKHAWGAQMALLHESESLLTEMKQMKAEVREFGYKQADLALKQAMYTYLAVLDDRIDAQTEVVIEQRQRAEQARQAWLLARRETKKVATLREREYARFKQEEQRKEQKELDDMRPHGQK